MNTDTRLSLRKWNGRTKEAFLWKGFGTEKAQGCWAKDANCLIFLSHEAEEQGDWSLGVNFEDLVTSKCKPLLMRLKTRSISNQRCEPLHNDTTAGSNPKLPTSKCWLCLEPPEHYNAAEKEQFNVTTRNFFAWMVKKPLVGPDPALALLGVKYRMDMWRSPGQDNYSTIFQYAKHQGYGDLGDIQSVLTRRLKGEYKLPTDYKLETKEKGPANVTFFSSTSSRPLARHVNELDTATTWIQNLSKDSCSLPSLSTVPQLPQLTLTIAPNTKREPPRIRTWPSERHRISQRRHAGFSAPPSAIAEDKQAERFWQTHQLSMHRALRLKYPNTSAISLPEQTTQSLPMMSGALAGDDAPALHGTTSLAKKRQSLPPSSTHKTSPTSTALLNLSTSRDHAIGGLLTREVQHRRRSAGNVPFIPTKGPSRNSSSTSLAQAMPTSVTGTVERPQPTGPSPNIHQPCICVPEQDKKTPLERPLLAMSNFDPGIVFPIGRKKQLLQALDATIQPDAIPPKTPPTRFKSLRVARRAKSTKSIKQDVDKRNMRRSQIVSVEILPDADRPDSRDNSKRSSQNSDSINISAVDKGQRSSYLSLSSSTESLGDEVKSGVPTMVKTNNIQVVIEMRLDGTQLMDKLLADLHEL